MTGMTGMPEARPVGGKDGTITDVPGNSRIWAQDRVTTPFPLNGHRCHPMQPIASLCECPHQNGEYSTLHFNGITDRIISGQTVGQVTVAS